jgi:hypothetical protein
MLAFPLNTGELDYLVPIMLLNILPFRKFGSAAIFAKCIKTVSSNWYLEDLPILAFLLNA